MSLALKIGMKFSNICRLKRRSDSNSLLRLSEKPNYFVTGTCSPGRIRPSFILWGLRPVTLIALIRIPQRRIRKRRKISHYFKIQMKKLSNINTCFSALNTKMEENYQATCFFLKGSAKLLILNSVCFWMLVSNQSAMQFSRCGLIWRKTQNVVVSVAICN